MKQEIDQGLAARIRECAGIVGSGAELARISGINRRTLERYLAGESSPNAAALGSIAVAAEVSLDWLILGAGPKKREGGWALISQDARRFGIVMEKVEKAYLETKVVGSGPEYGRRALRIYEKVWDLEDEGDFDRATLSYINQLKRELETG